MANNNEYTVLSKLEENEAPEYFSKEDVEYYFSEIIDPILNDSPNKKMFLDCYYYAVVRISYTLLQSYGNVILHVKNKKEYREIDFFSLLYEDNFSGLTAFPKGENISNLDSDMDVISILSDIFQYRLDCLRYGCSSVSITKLINRLDKIFGNRISFELYCSITVIMSEPENIYSLFEGIEELLLKYKQDLKEENLFMPISVEHLMNLFVMATKEYYEILRGY